MASHTDDVRGLCAFVDASPSPYHAVSAATRLLTQAGFVRLAETDAWPTGPGRYLVEREGSLCAWAWGDGPASTPFRVIGAHTDSPNLRLRPRPDVRRLGWDQLAVEVYGGPILASWLDRDLGLSGRILLRETAAPGGVQTRLWRHDEPLLRIPHLAIHLDRASTDEGLRINPQTQLVPVWGATGDAPDFVDWLADRLTVRAEDVLAYDLMTHDLTPPGPLGREGDLLASPRLDNLASSYAGVRALVDAGARAVAGTEMPHVPVLVLFDHEEIGSLTNRGGQSQYLPAVLERIVLGRGGQREDLLRALAGSVVCSADMTHAVHPNYAERYEPGHLVLPGAGPAVKVNVKGRYASDASGVAEMTLAARLAGVNLQTFVSRGDMPCGSTIGPMTAALTGAVTVDVGAPMLSMHSARELMAAADVSSYVELLRAFLTPE